MLVFSSLEILLAPVRALRFMAHSIHSSQELYHSHQVSTRQHLGTISLAAWQCSAWRAGCSVTCVLNLRVQVLRP